MVCGRFWMHFQKRTSQVFPFSKVHIFGLAARLGASRSRSCAKQPALRANGRAEPEQVVGAEPEP